MIAWAGAGRALATTVAMRPYLLAALVAVSACASEPPAGEPIVSYVERHEIPVGISAELIQYYQQAQGTPGVYTTRPSASTGSRTTGTSSISGRARSAAPRS